MTRAKRYGLTAAFNRVAPPPEAPRDNTVDLYHGINVADPFRPLENLDADSTAEWVAKQNARFQSFIEGSPVIADTKAFLQRAMDYPKQTIPARYEQTYFYYAKEGLSAQYDYFVRDGADGTPRILIDANNMSKDGTVSLSGVYPSPDGKLVAYTVAEAGSDAVTLKIRDVATGEDLPDSIPNLRFTGATWDRDSSAGFTYNAPAKDDLKRFISMHHTVGDPVEKDEYVFGLREESAFVSTFRVKGNNATWGNVYIGTLPSNGLWMRPEGAEEFREIFPHGVAKYSPIAEIDGKILMQTDYDAPRGKIVLFDPAKPDPEHWETVIAEDWVHPLHWAMRHKDVLLVEYGVDTADRLSVYDLTGNHLHDAPTPVQSTLGFGRVNKDDDVLTISMSDFRQPGAIH